MLGAGRYDHLVRFESNATATDDYGVEGPGSWGLLEEAWSAIRWGTGEERRQAASDGASQTATFRVKSTAALRTVTPDPSFRIIDDAGTAWNIAGVSPIGVNEEIEFTATTRKG